MKNLQRVILVIIAATVFLTGMGVTVFNFCCPSCSEQTLFMTEKHTCCSQKQEQPKTNGHTSCCSQESTINKNSCASTTFESMDYCSSSRLSIDIDASSFRPQVSTPFVWLSETLPNTLSYALPFIDGDTKDYAQLKTPSTTPPRENLSLIRVLII